MKRNIYNLLLAFLLLFTGSLQAQSPYRIFTLDSNLNTDNERQTASIVLKALVINKFEFIYQNESRFKPFHKIDLKKLRATSDSLFRMLPSDGEFSWEEDYGLRLEGQPKQERWKELTFYKTDFDASKGPKEVMNGKKTYVIQFRIWIDLNGQIEDIQSFKGKKMTNRDDQIKRSYNILYKPKK